MANPGQSSGEFASALRILYVGHRNSLSATLTTDGFTQTNPPIVTANKSAQLSATPKYGILGGSVCLTRPDAGNGMVGGPIAAAPGTGACKPLGLFVNDAAGNAYENSPTVASGQATYVSSQGTFGCTLFETKNLDSGADLVWAAGDSIYCSRNGYLTNVDDQLNALESAHAGADGSSTLLGIVKIAPDAESAELYFDLRV